MNTFCENEKLIDLKNWSSRVSAWMMCDVLLNIRVEDTAYFFDYVAMKSRLLVTWTKQKSTRKTFIQEIFVSRVKQYVNFDQSTNVISMNDQYVDRLNDLSIDELNDDFSKNLSSRSLNSSSNLKSISRASKIKCLCRDKQSIFNCMQRNDSSRNLNRTSSSSAVTLSKSHIIEIDVKIKSLFTWEIVNHMLTVSEQYNTWSRRHRC